MTWKTVAWCSGIVITVSVFWTGCSLFSAVYGQEVRRVRVPVETRHISVFETGDGVVPVVFESGWGDGASVWNETGLFTRVGHQTEAIAYDRAGYGESASADDGRHVIDLVSDLHSVLEGRHIEKAILVGHSYGGAIAMAFATLHPERVHSLVLIDPTPYSFEPEGGQDRSIIAEYAEATFGTTDPSTREAYQIASSLEWIAKNPVPMSLPVTVITAMRTNREWSSSRRQRWFRAHSVIGRGSLQFHHIKAPESGHYVMIDDPNLVFDVIKREVDSIKRLLSGAT